MGNIAKLHKPWTYTHEMPHVFNCIRFTFPLLVATCIQLGAASGGEPELERSGRVTLGGTQYWTDYLVCHDWRIQRNVKFGQFRLLKPNNRVAEHGTYEECRRAFDTMRRDATFPPIHSAVLVTLHGLGRTRNSMTQIGSYVAKRGDLGWINFGYASTRAPIVDNARALRHALNELSELKREQDAKLESNAEDQRAIEFHFIGHSLGNIVIRHLLGEIERDEQEGRTAPWRVGRIVMLGPPNQGSAMANVLKENVAFRLIAGSSGMDLGAEWDVLKEQLTTPKCEFAVIAGGKGDNHGYNPLLSGDDDLIVRVEETRLSGAADFAVVSSIHTYLMNRDESKQMALRFIRDGCLTSSDVRHRIP